MIPKDPPSVQTPLDERRVFLYTKEYHKPETAE